MERLSSGRESAAQGLALFHLRRIVRIMGQSFGNEFTLVEVVTDSAVRGIPKRQLWVAAAKPDQQ